MPAPPENRSLEGYLPGCYRNLPCETGESLAGYLARLAEGNGYPGVRALLHAASVPYAGSTRTQILKLCTDQAQLACLSRMAVGDPHHLDHFVCEPLPHPSRTHPMQVPTEALYRNERRVDLDALLPVRAPVCTQCLDEFGYVREEWELAPVTVCSIHGCQLIDQCAKCKSGLSWDRPEIALCGQCQQDLRAIRIELASDGAREVSADFEALAPFRLADRHGHPYIVDWDEMFKAVKALLLPDWNWAKGEFPKLHVAQTTIAARHVLIERLARVRSNSRYDMSEFQAKGRRALAPLRALPFEHALEEIAAHLLEAEVGLSRELAVALSGLVDRGDPARAVEVFGGVPPVVGSEYELERALNATTNEVKRLLSLNVIRPRGASDFGYDADDLLRARRYLDSLVNTDGLTRLVGVTVRNEDLHPQGLFPRWSLNDRTDGRVAPEKLTELQLGLIAQWHRAEAPTDPVTLRSLAAASDRPLEVVIAVIKDILIGTIKQLTWKPPFTWVDIAVDRTEVGLAARLLA